MKFGTVCSGVEAVSVGWIPSGFEPVFYSEIEPFPKAVLKHHFPDVPCFGDFTAIRGADLRGKLQALWGSTPCQSFSKAGARGGLASANGQLTLAFANLVNQIDPDYLVWENVKGVLSDNDNAFGQLLGELVGWGEVPRPDGGKWGASGWVVGPRRRVAWRQFDAQYGGLACRRKRIFLVGCPASVGDPRDILFERASDRAHLGERPDPVQRANPWTGRPKHVDGPFAVNFDRSPKVSEDLAFTLRADKGSGHWQAAVFRDADGTHAINLTPEMRERLMGLPLGWTDIEWSGGRTLELARAAAIGNSVAVPDAAWIGSRIMAHSRGDLTEHYWP